MVSLFKCIFSFSTSKSSICLILTVEDIRLPGPLLVSDPHAFLAKILPKLSFLWTLLSLPGLLASNFTFPTLFGSLYGWVGVFTLDQFRQLKVRFVLLAFRFLVNTYIHIGFETYINKYIFYFIFDFFHVAFHFGVIL